MKFKMTVKQSYTEFSKTVSIDLTPSKSNEIAEWLEAGYTVILTPVEEGVEQDDF